MNENMGVVEQVTVQVTRESNIVAYLVILLAIVGLVYLAYLLIKRGRN